MLDPTITTDVANFRPSLFEDARDEEPPVAVEWILLAAHDRDAIARCHCLEPFDAAQEGLGNGQASVEDVALVIVELVVLRSPAKLLSEEHVPDALALQGRRNGLSGELRRVAGVRLRAHVGDSVDGVEAQELEEDPEAVVRMPDRVDRGVRVRHAHDCPSLLGRSAESPLPGGSRR